jgi:hypothetical protein
MSSNTNNNAANTIGAADGADNAPGKFFVCSSCIVEFEQACFKLCFSDSAATNDAANTRSAADGPQGKTIVFR